MNRIDRLMGLITHLQSKRQATVAQLATHFGISERTVFRDLKALGEIGIPITFDPDKGYSVANGFFLPPVSLTVDEANALSLAEPLIVRFADLSVQRHYSSAIEKIKMVLSRAQRDGLERTRAGTAHFIPDHYAHLLPDSDYLVPLQQAITQKNIVVIEYVNQQEEASTREVEPIGLTFYSLNWHLIAWCHKRQGYRDFRTNRIQSLKISLKPFRKTDHISLNDYILQVQEDIFKNTEHPLT
jgi:predicted DNA-binding transcriptional regulator YafY